MDSSCPSIGISTGICWYVDALYNFNTSLLLHFTNFPISHLLPIVVLHFQNFRPSTGPALPSIVLICCDLSMRLSHCPDMGCFNVKNNQKWWFSEPRFFDKMPTVVNLVTCWHRQTENLQVHSSWLPCQLEPCGQQICVMDSGAVGDRLEDWQKPGGGFNRCSVWNAK